MRRANPCSKSEAIPIDPKKPPNAALEPFDLDAAPLDLRHLSTSLPGEPTTD